jgi:shikimate dehydrogenase
MLTSEIIQKYNIIINCTPLGTHPNIDSCPDIPYASITNKHLLYDLVYNPSETKFLKLGKNNGAQICNGYNMLQYQAEKAWEIWNTTL